MSALPVQIEGLEYAYPDGTTALRNITLTVQAGEAVAIVGANGAGKSTLLLHLNGCLRPTSGQVRIGDVAVERRTVARVRAAVGLVFQDPDDQLFMPSVFEDVAFAPLHAGLAPRDAERIAVQALERVGLPHLRERPPYRLSAGEKRAVAIASVLTQSPSVLALDEPSANLDPRSRRRLIELLQSLETTRLVATHDLELALAVCGRTAVLDRGELVAYGPTRDVLADEPLMLRHGLERPASLGGATTPRSGSD